MLEQSQNFQDPIICLYESLCADAKKSGCSVSKDSRILSSVPEETLKKAYAQYRVGQLFFIASPRTKTWELWGSPMTMKRLEIATRSPTEIAQAHTGAHVARTLAEKRSETPRKNTPPQETTGIVI